MRVSKSYILRAKQTIMRYLVQEYCKKFNVGPDIAMSIILRTKTYTLLSETDSNLWTEMSEYVWDKLQAELRGDWEDWMRD